MKYFIIYILGFFIMLNSQTAQAQNADTLYLKSTFWGNKFYKGDTIYSINGVLEELALQEHNSLITGSNKWNYKPVYHFGLSSNGLQLRIRF